MPPIVTPDAIALVTALISLTATVVQVHPAHRRPRRPLRRPPGARRRVAARRVSVRTRRQSR
jgi:hypothetical protein